MFITNGHVSNLTPNWTRRNFASRDHRNPDNSLFLSYIHHQISTCLRLIHSPPSSFNFLDHTPADDDDETPSQPSLILRKRRANAGQRSCHDCHHDKDIVQWVVQFVSPRCKDSLKYRLLDIDNRPFGQHFLVIFRFGRCFRHCCQMA